MDASSAPATALANRLTQICSDHSLGDPLVYARWAGAMQFRRSADENVHRDAEFSGSFDSLIKVRCNRPTACLEKMTGQYVVVSIGLNLAKDLHEPRGIFRSGCRRREQVFEPRHGTTQHRGVLMEDPQDVLRRSLAQEVPKERLSQWHGRWKVGRRIDRNSCPKEGNNPPGSSSCFPQEPPAVYLGFVWPHHECASARAKVDRR